MVWVIALGQMAIGLLATGLIIQRLYDVPNSFGMLIETGFAGGHGTAAAMGQVFAHPSVDLDGGLDLGILMATGGLLYGLVSGIVWVNLGVRAGWVRRRTSARSSASRGPSESAELIPIGFARIGGDTIDPLLLQMVWLTLAFAIGLGLQWLVTWAAGLVEVWMTVSTETSEAQSELSKRLGLQAMVGTFPLFIYTLFGGLAVRKILQAFGLDRAIDRETINRLTSSSHGHPRCRGDCHARSSSRCDSPFSL